jgi:hypothetical protein
MTPRAQADPALNRWLKDVLPPLDQIGCRVKFHDTTTNAVAERDVTLRDLDVQPLDLLYLISGENQQAMSELDDRIVRHVVGTHAPRPDIGAAIAYMERGSAKCSLFELLPLIASLRKLALGSRPLRASDLTVATEGAAKQDESVSASAARVTLPRTALSALRTDLDAFRVQLEGPPGNVDVLIDGLVEHFAKAARFGVPQTGWGFAYEWRQRQFRSLLKKADELVQRWNARLEEFGDVMIEFNALPIAATEERFKLLQRAERLVSTATIHPLPPTPAALNLLIDGQRNVFDARRADFEKIATTQQTAFTDLLADVKALLPISDFDVVEFSVAEEEQQVAILTQDIRNAVKAVIAEMDRRLDASNERLIEHGTAATPSARVQALQSAAKVLLGDDVVFIPEFTSTAAQADEIANALVASRSGELFEHLTTVEGVDFPVDEWLYGVARVREKMGAWEQVLMLSGGFGQLEPELTAVQLPFRPDDDWLGMKFPATYTLDRDRLLYTAHFAVDFAKGAPQCGLLLDEWSEVIPAGDATTGIAFHYDRPNTEAPQTMLLVTPTDFRGAWQWADLVDALNETLDLAKTRAVEPAHIDATAYARFLPATVMATTRSGVTISADLAVNNNLNAFSRS